ncbi:cytochrome P450 [Dendrothele bispora CBS 962.96]|uniref:Cytochrome P450 n=1 Tax=Dendrothele bispora (strain CBS 962.96) TaxID=1314807 RepID=A0A4S8LEK5_DENBC|nr:cytochrome P450 [Dendrothele bispora CBS 962.96]
MSSLNNNLVVVFLFSLTIIFAIYHTNNKKHPPGPRGLPILGNIFQLDPDRPWISYAKWKRIYGDLFQLNMAGQPILVLNSQKVVKDLLEKRSSIYSDRPKWLVVNELTGCMDLPLMRYGELWRRMRRASEVPLGVKMTSNYHRVQSDQALMLAHGVLNQPENWKFHVQRASISTILSIVYDTPPIQSLSEPLVQFMDHLINRTEAALLPGSNLVEIFPILSYLPLFLSKWKLNAQRDFKMLTRQMEDMFLPIKNRFDKGEEQPPSFCATLAETQTRHRMSDSECAWLAAVLYGAGQETTSTALGWFLLCMILFPRVQGKAQEELDKIVGRARLPSFSDMKHLPYIQAIVKEVLRWQVPLTLGVPHATTEDNYYEGYLIRKGTICIVNVRGLNRDPDIYGPDADDFRPERYLDDEGMIKDETSDGHFAYGFGHRICVGRHVANNSLFIAIATILWSMTINPVKGADGNPINPDLEGEPGVFWRPKPFSFSTKPRFDDAKFLVQQARDDIN